MRPNDCCEPCDCTDYSKFDVDAARDVNFSKNLENILRRIKNESEWGGKSVKYESKVGSRGLPYTGTYSEGWKSIDIYGNLGEVNKPRILSDLEKRGFKIAITEETVEVAVNYFTKYEDSKVGFLFPKKLRKAIFETKKETFNLKTITINWE